MSPERKKMLSIRLNWFWKAAVVASLSFIAVELNSLTDFLVNLKKDSIIHTEQINQHERRLNFDEALMASNRNEYLDLFMRKK